jgi:5-methylcytosine-specific restriction endonuclease McrA
MKLPRLLSKLEPAKPEPKAGKFSPTRAVGHVVHPYQHRRWRARRARQLQAEPLCRMCAAKGITRAADTADHIVDHKGDPGQFWFGELQSLCSECHRAKTGRDNAPSGGSR